MTTFFLKDAFPDISHAELFWMTKHLKAYLDSSRVSHPEKKLRAGDRWPSNAWPEDAKLTACSLLYAIRNLKEDALKEEIELQTVYAPTKWKFGTPYFRPDWEDLAIEYGLMEKRVDPKEAEIPWPQSENGTMDEWTSF